MGTTWRQEEGEVPPLLDLATKLRMVRPLYVYDFLEMKVETLRVCEIGATKAEEIAHSTRAKGVLTKLGNTSV